MHYGINKLSNDLCVKRTFSSIILCPSVYNFLHLEMFKNTSLACSTDIIHNLPMCKWAG